MFILYGRRKGDTVSMYWDTAVGDELTLHPLFTDAQALKVVNFTGFGLWLSKVICHLKKAFPCTCKYLISIAAQY